MTARILIWTALGPWLAAGVMWMPGVARGQTRPGIRPVQPRQAAGPRQQVAPRQPQLQVRTPPKPQLPPGFPLPPQQEAYLDQVLRAWEQHSQKVKTFECAFTRWEYDKTYGQPNVPKFIERGKLKYASPDRGMLEVTHSEKNGQVVPIDPMRAEKWVCNGKSIFKYDYVPNPKQLIEYPLPPALQGKAIQDGPLPFLFGAEAAKMKQRYFIRVIPSPKDSNGQPRQGEIWLEAYPRRQQDAANFMRAELILRVKDVMPMGLHIFDPGGKQHVAYMFWDIKTNDPLRFFRGDPFHAATPRGWKKKVDDSATRQAGRPPVTVPKR